MTSSSKDGHSPESGSDDGAGDVVRSTTSELTFANHWDHFLARFGWNRMGHMVEPGLYSLGSPGKDSPVFVTANYTLSFDSLRSNLKGMEGDCWLLVMDTQGVNVWCSAGKGTFSTSELIRKIEDTRLREKVGHNQIILPQLGAPGIEPHEVKRATGFRVEYGPIRSRDIPEYMRRGRKTTPGMRKVTFPFFDRVKLSPMEANHALLPLLIGLLALTILLGPLAAIALLAAVLTGVLVFPMALPWVPTKDFSSKGFILGVLVAAPFGIAFINVQSGTPLWVMLLGGAAYIFSLSPVTAFLSLNFTGSSTFTSRTGVIQEMARYVPVMVWMFGLGVVMALVLVVLRFLGVVRWI